MRPHCILIVDDEPLVRSSLSRLFQQEGFDCLLASNSDDALRLLRQRKVSVIFSDDVLPGHTGLSFLKKVKKEYPRIVRVVLDGCRRSFNHRKGHRPFSIEALGQ